MRYNRLTGFLPLRPATVLVGAALAFGLIGAALWRRHGEDARLREAALPACIERLGSETACLEHQAKDHDECAVLTRRYPSKYTGIKGGPSPEAYLDCIVLGVDAWVEQNRLRHERAAHQR